MDQKPHPIGSRARFDCVLGWCRGQEQYLVHRLPLTSTGLRTRTLQRDMTRARLRCSLGCRAGATKAWR